MIADNSDSNLNAEKQINEEFKRELSPHASVVAGPAAAPRVYRDNDFDTCFRVLTLYDVESDSIFTRFDVGCNVRRSEGENLLRNVKWDQFNGACYTVSSDMLIPNAGIIGGVAVKANAKELSAILRGLADAIDQNSK